MGGALNVPGNVSPVAEANIAGDPDAADIVVTAPWKVTMIALDTTTQVKLSDDILLRIRGANSRGKPLVTTAIDVDVHRFLKTFESVMTSK